MLAKKGSEGVDMKTWVMERWRKGNVILVFDGVNCLEGGDREV